MEYEEKDKYHLMYLISLQEFQYADLFLQLIDEYHYFVYIIVVHHVLIDLFLFNKKLLNKKITTTNNENY